MESLTKYQFKTFKDGGDWVEEVMKKAIRRHSLPYFRDSASHFFY